MRFQSAKHKKKWLFKKNMGNEKGETNEVSSGKVRSAQARLYCPDAQEYKTITLTADQIRHLKVLRLKDGDPIRVFDGKGQDYEGYYNEKVRAGKLYINSVQAPEHETHVKITLATAVPKGDRIDVLVEKVSELGIGTIIPVLFERSVVDPRPAKIERLNRIAQEAACQSKRSLVPIVTSPLKFADLLKTFGDYTHIFMCHSSGTPLIRHPEPINPGDKVLIIVGPEGDFSDDEFQVLHNNYERVKKVSLARSILRVETAGIAAAAQIAGKIEYHMHMQRVCPG